jgi:hypothetical protein
MADEKLTVTHWAMVHPDAHPGGSHGPACHGNPCGRCREYEAADLHWLIGAGHDIRISIVQRYKNGGADLRLRLIGVGENDTDMEWRGPLFVTLEQARAWSAEAGIAP